MGIYTFSTDLMNSHRIVKKFADLLESSGYKVYHAPDEYFPDWDLCAECKRTGLQITFELKNDELASQTGNVGIEFESRGRPSGIARTQAVYWVHYFDEKFHLVQTEKLRREAALVSFRTVVGGDQGSNTKMFLIRIPSFLELCDCVLR